MTQMKNNKIEIHDFYCLNCGQKSMSLPRQRNHLHGKFHRKKLYCPRCKKTLNAIEIKNDEEYYVFKQNFLLGLYQLEAQDSLATVGNFN